MTDFHKFSAEGKDGFSDEMTWSLPKNTLPAITKFSERKKILWQACLPQIVKISQPGKGLNLLQQF